MVVAESSKPSLLASSSTSSFQTAKSFWSDISDGGSKSRDSSSSETPSPIKADPIRVTVDRDVSGSPSKATVSKLPLPSSAASSSFYAVKSFWSEISGTSSFGAIIDGAKDVKFPCGPSAISGRTEVCKTSKVGELSRYTVNCPVYIPIKAQSSSPKTPILRSEGGSVGGDRPKFRSRIPVPTASYHVTKTEQSRHVPLRAVIGVSASQSSMRPPVNAGSFVSGPSSSTSSYRTAESYLTIASDGDASVSRPKTTSTVLPTSIPPINDSAQDQNTVSIQSQLWHDVLKLYTSGLSSCPPLCDCNDCIWSSQEEIDCCSMVAHVDAGECHER